MGNQNDDKDMATLSQDTSQRHKDDIHGYEWNARKT